MESKNIIKKEKATSFMKNVAMLMLAQILIKILGFAYRLVIINIEGFGDVGNRILWCRIYSIYRTSYTIFCRYSNSNIKAGIRKSSKRRL